MSTPSRHSCDVAVVGRGPLGAAAAAHLARAGVDVSLIGPDEPADRSTHDGVFGSHYDSGRIVRVIDRDPFYADIAAASIARYRELEDRSRIQFFFDVGHLTVSATPDYLEDLLAQDRRHELNCRVLDDVGLEATFPRLRFAPKMTGVHEQGTGGYLNPRALIAAQCAAVVLDGGVIIAATVTDIAHTASGNVITTDTGGTITCGKLLLATGAFANRRGVIPEQVSFEVDRHTVVLGELDSPAAGALSDMPSVIYKRSDSIGDSVYVLPPIAYPDGRTYVKIGQSVGERMPDPATELVPWFQGDGDPTIAAWLEEELRALLPDTSIMATHSESCVVTRSPTNRPFIDHFPDTSVYALLADNGQVAKSADELGRMAAVRLLSGELPHEYDEASFAIRYP